MRINNFLITAVVLMLLAFGVPIASASDNIVPNSSVENSLNGSPTDWHQGYLWGDLDAQYQYVNSGYQSNFALRSTITRYNSGDAKWYFTPQPVVAGQSYLFTDYYIANASSRAVAMIEHTGGSTTYQELRSVAPTSTWTQYSDTFTTPLSATKVSVLHLISSVGFLTTDAFSLTAQSVNNSAFERGLVSVTFDDGWKSIYQNALPILEQNSIKSTQHITTGFVGLPEYMSLPEVREFYAKGHQIASHGVNHYDLTSLSRKRLISELTQSKLYLERNVGGTVSHIAAPYGAYNNTTITQIKKYYRSQRTSDVGFNTKSGFDAYRLRSHHITPITTLDEFRGWVNTATTEKSWLILMYHNVDYSGSAYSVTPEMLSAQMVEIKNSALTSKTVDQALNELSPQL